MGNSYIGCHYMEEIQKSHRKTGYTNSHDQEITCNTCPFVVHCRKSGLCRIPGTGRQKILSWRMTAGPSAEQFVLCTEESPYVVLS